MTIVQALKNDDLRDVRITCYDRWLCWYQDQWTVFERKRRQRNSTIIIQTDNEAEAVAALVNQ